jgi:hypothetical protein
MLGSEGPGMAGEELLGIELGVGDGGFGVFGQGDARRFIFRVVTFLDKL